MTLQIKSFISAATDDEAIALAIHSKGFGAVIGKIRRDSPAPLPRQNEADQWVAENRDAPTKARKTRGATK
jgi:hypothetical protein